MTTTYKFTCTYCGNKWQMTFKYTNPTCGSCKDKNIKCEEIKKDSHYDSEKESDNQHDYWRD
jgi:hypothetical protein